MIPRKARRRALCKDALHYIARTHHPARSLPHPWLPGIYYPQGSLKAQLCVAGKKQLYDFCERYGVPHSRLGKLLVATRAEQLSALTALQASGAQAGVPLQWLSKEQVVHKGFGFADHDVKDC